MRLGRATWVRTGNVGAAGATAIAEMQYIAFWGPSVTHPGNARFREPEDAGPGRCGASRNVHHQWCTTSDATGKFRVKHQGVSWMKQQPRSRPARCPGEVRRRCSECRLTWSKMSRLGCTGWRVGRKHPLGAAASTGAARELAEVHARCAWRSRGREVTSPFPGPS